MTERDQTPHAASAAPDGVAARPDRAASPDPAASWREHTTPGMQPVPQQGASGGGSTAVGSGAHGYPGAGEGHSTTPQYSSAQYSTAPVKVRRGDPLAALLLILAGLAAAVSLLLRWLAGRDATGWDILKQAFDTSSAGIGTLFSSGFWQPLAILLGGGVLFVLGLLMLIPAKAHRFLGLLALLVSFAVVAGVLVPLAQAHWRLAGFTIGFHLAMAVAALGLLGSLKALLTGPKLGAPRAR